MAVSNDKAVTRTTDTNDPNLDPGTAPAGEPRAMRLPSIEHAALAYQRCQHEIEALSPEDVGRVTLEVPRAVSVALTAIPDIASLMPLMRGIFVRPPEEVLARMEERALALFHAHVRYTPVVSAQLEVVLEEARVLRERLLTAAEYHAAFGTMNLEAVAVIREGTGHYDRVSDLEALASLFTAGWASVAFHTHITTAEVERARELAKAVLFELGLKARGLGSAAESKVWSDRRNRAYRLFIMDYDFLRATVAYARYWEGDGDDYAPSLYPARRSAKPVAEPTAPPAVPPAPPEPSKTTNST